MKKLMLLTGLLAFLLFSCDGDLTGNGGNGGNTDTPETKKFWAQNWTNKSFYQLDAELLAKGTYCNVWVEKGSANKDEAKKVADEYDQKIYSKMIDNFGFKEDITDNGVVIAKNAIEYADWMGDGDGKLTILLLDIKDGYSSTNRAYTAGYFWSGDLLINESDPLAKNSNKRDIIFVDTNPGLNSNAKNTYATLAHELQHMMSFVTGLLAKDEDLDEWIDEGLSSAAEWVYLGDHTTNGRVKNYNDNPSKLIDKGNNFFVWGNRTSGNSNAILDDYSTVYLFFQWLRLQTSKDIYRYITTSGDYDYKAVTSSFSELMPVGNGYSDWSKLLETWLAANRINASSGIYGYKDETTLKEIKAPYAPTSISAVNIQLYPGEGVYSKVNSKPLNLADSTNIQYSYLTTTVSSEFVAGDLLTFNKNTSIAGNAESGTTTGLASASVVTEGRSVQSDEPIRMDAKDILRQNGNLPNIAGSSRINRVRIHSLSRLSGVQDE